MFNGKTLKGWKPNENDDSFWVKDGCIVANAPGRCHLFYQTDKPFKNFEFKAPWTKIKANKTSNAPAGCDCGDGAAVGCWRLPSPRI